MAVELGLKKAEDCHWDALSLGEIMLRLDPGEGRIRTTRHFAAWEGGGEYNVVRGLRKVFGMRTGAITALAPVVPVAPAAALVCVLEYAGAARTWAFVP